MDIPADTALLRHHQAAALPAVTPAEAVHPAVIPAADALHREVTPVVAVHPLPAEAVHLHTGSI